MKRSIFPLFLTFLFFLDSEILYSQNDIFESIAAVGKMDHWTTRIIEESAVIGGNTAYLYEPSLRDGVIKGRYAYRNPQGCYWRTSNAYADVLGVVKTSTSVFPEKRGDGYCARLEVRMARIKVLGLVNMDVVCQGSLFLGTMREPISDTRDPQSKLDFGVCTDRCPSALVLDYKAIVGGKVTCATGLGRVRQLDTRDYAELVVILQYRWEGEDGRVYAKRVGTGIFRITESQHEWINGFRVPIMYGDIRNSPDFRPYMGLIPEELSNYTENSRGENVPVREIGWASDNVKPNHMIVRFSSSCGEAFYGAVGNKLWIDNVRFVFD